MPAKRGGGGYRGGGGHAKPTDFFSRADAQDAEIHGAPYHQQGGSGRGSGGGSADGYSKRGGRGYRASYGGGPSWRGGGGGGGGGPQGGPPMALGGDDYGNPNRRPSGNPNASGSDIHTGPSTPVAGGVPQDSALYDDSSKRGTKDIGVIRTPTITRGRGRGAAGVGSKMSSPMYSGGGGDEGGDGGMATPTHDMSREQTTDYQHHERGPPHHMHHHHASAQPGGAPQPGHPHYHADPSNEGGTVNNPYASTRYRGSPAPQGGAAPYGGGGDGGYGGYQGGAPHHHHSSSAPYQQPSPNPEGSEAYTRPYQPHSHHQHHSNHNQYAPSGGYQPHSHHSHQQQPNAPSFFNNNSGGGAPPPAGPGGPRESSHSQHAGYYYNNDKGPSSQQGPPPPQKGGRDGGYPHHSQHAPQMHNNQHQYGYPSSSGPPPFTTNFSQRQPPPQGGGGDGRGEGNSGGNYYENSRDGHRGGRGGGGSMHSHHQQHYQPHSAAQHPRGGGGGYAPHQHHQSHHHNNSGHPTHLNPQHLADRNAPPPSGPSGGGYPPTSNAAHPPKQTPSPHPQADRDQTPHAASHPATPHVNQHQQPPPQTKPSPQASMVPEPKSVTEKNQSRAGEEQQQQPSGHTNKRQQERPPKEAKEPKHTEKAVEVTSKPASSKPPPVPTPQNTQQAAPTPAQPAPTAAAPVAPVTTTTTTAIPLSRSQQQAAMIAQQQQQHSSSQPPAQAPTSGVNCKHYQDTCYNMLVPSCPRDFDFSSSEAYTGIQVQLTPTSNPSPERKKTRFFMLQEPCYWRVGSATYNGEYGSDNKIILEKPVRLTTIHNDPNANFGSFLTSVSPRVKALPAACAAGSSCQMCRGKVSRAGRPSAYPHEMEHDLKSMWRAFDAPEGVNIGKSESKKYTCTLSGLNLEWSADSANQADERAQAIHHRRLLYKVLSCVEPSVEAHRRQQAAEESSKIPLTFFQRSIADEIAAVLFGGDDVCGMASTAVSSAKDAEEALSSVLPGWKKDVTTPADFLSQPLHPLHTILIANLRHQLSKSEEGTESKAALQKELLHFKHYLPHYALQTAAGWNAFVSKVKTIFTQPLPTGGGEAVESLVQARAYEVLAAMRQAQVDETNPVLLNHRQRVESTVQTRLKLSSTPSADGAQSNETIQAQEGEFITVRRRANSITWFNNLRPHDRAPLHDTVDLLSNYLYPALKRASNVDFTFNSWVAVLWKPQYDGSSTRSNSAGSFLTYYAIRPARFLFRPKSSPLTLAMRFFDDAERRALDSVASTLIGSELRPQVQSLADRLKAATDTGSLGRLVAELSKIPGTSQYLSSVKNILEKDTDLPLDTHGPFISDRFAWDNGTPECAVFRCDSRVFSGSKYATWASTDAAAGPEIETPTSASPSQQYTPPVSLWESETSQNTMLTCLSKIQNESVTAARHVTHVSSAEPPHQSISVPIVACIPIKMNVHSWMASRMDRAIEGVVSAARGEAIVLKVHQGRSLKMPTPMTGNLFDLSREAMDRLDPNTLNFFPLYLIATAAELMAQSTPSFSTSILANFSLHASSTAYDTQSFDLAGFVRSSILESPSSVDAQDLTSAQTDYQTVFNTKIIVDSSVARAEVIQGTLGSGRQLEDYNRIVTTDASTKLFIDNVLSGAFAPYVDDKGTFLPTTFSSAHCRANLWPPPNKVSGRKDGLEDMI